MNRAMTLNSALATWMLAATTVLAQNGLQQPQLVAPADQQAEILPLQSDNLTQTSFDDEATAPAEEPAADDAAASSGCGCEEPACGCEEASCGCDSGCDDGCCLFGDCCLGDAMDAQELL